MQIIEITSRQNPLVSKLVKLAGSPNSYQKTGEAWLEGEHLCQAYLDKVGSLLAVICNESSYQQQTYLKLKVKTSVLYVLTDVLFDLVSNLQSVTGMGFLIAVPAKCPLNALAPSIILDRLQDPGNAGSILRSAAAFGFKQVIALKGTCALWSPKVLRAGMGAHFSLQIIEQCLLDDLAALKTPLLTTSSHASTFLHEAKLPWPCAWIFSNEGQGVDEMLLHKSKLTVCIDQPGGEESLNAAIAASICMYESTRQNTQP